MWSLVILPALNMALLCLSCLLRAAHFWYPGFGCVLYLKVGTRWPILGIVLVSCQISSCFPEAGSSLHVGSRCPIQGIVLGPCEISSCSCEVGGSLPVGSKCPTLGIVLVGPAKSILVFRRGKFPLLILLGVSLVALNILSWFTYSSLKLS